MYSQELTKEVRLVSKKAEDTGITYWGIRMYLASHGILHGTEEEDDRSAITFWIPNSGTFNKHDLAAMFDKMSKMVLGCPDPQRND